MDHQRENTLLWLRLSRARGLGPATGARLLEAFGGPREVLSSDRSSLCSVKGVRAETAESILDPGAVEEAERELDKCTQLGIKVIPLDHPGYPQPLKTIPDPPLVLYMKGEYKRQDQDAVAMVGCRNPDPYGESMAASLASGLARRGVTVVSGMARGIDAACQRAALKAGGRSIAVLGAGVDVVYPPEHKKLYQELIENGALISEFPPSTPPEPGNFPRRNRTMSGLSKGVVMVQAMSHRSGALITVRHALEQNRSVYAVPGNAGSRGGMIGNSLIKQGAVLAETAEDVLCDLRPLDEIELQPAGEDGKPAGEPSLADEQARIYALVPPPAEGAVDLDAVARQAGVAVSEAAAALLELELAGLIKCMPGKRYVRLSG